MVTVKSEVPSLDQGRPVRRLDTPEAREYAEWCLLVQDLERCLRVARLWKEKDEAGDVDVAVSLFRDAVVSLISCFEKPNTVSLDAQALYGRYDGGVEYYQWLSTIRDTWVAHRHGTSRQTSAAIVVDENSGDFLGAGNMLMTYSRPVLAGTDDFIMFVSIATAEAKARQGEAQLVVERQAKSLTPSQRLRLPIANVKSATGGALRIGRRKFANATRLTAKQLHGLRDKTPSDEGQG